MGPASTAARSEYLIPLLELPLGRMPITDIEPADILAAVRRIKRKGCPMAQGAGAVSINSPSIGG
jgi:hypothetical protein